MIGTLGMSAFTDTKIINKKRHLLSLLFLNGTHNI